MARVMLIYTLLFVLGVIRYAQADCYPGDITYTSIVQQIYHGVTSDSIVLTNPNQPGGVINRQNLCTTLTNHHNSGKNQGQALSNRYFLGTYVTHAACVNALTYTTGYNDISGWQKWAGYHSGTWYGSTQQFADGARWSVPTYKSGNVYVLQPVRFDSQDRIDHCVTKDMTGATCRYGWNQSGTGVQYVWGWDPKDNGCMNGIRGAVVGFTFSIGTTHCIVWVTTEEAFLECVKGNRRTSTTSSSYAGYGQWTIS